MPDSKCSRKRGYCAEVSRGHVWFPWTLAKVAGYRTMISIKPIELPESMPDSDSTKKGPVSKASQSDKLHGPQFRSPDSHAEKCSTGEPVSAFYIGLASDQRLSKASAKTRIIPLFLVKWGRKNLGRRPFLSFVAHMRNTSSLSSDNVPLTGYQSSLGCRTSIPNPFASRAREPASVSLAVMSSRNFTPLSIAR